MSNIEKLRTSEEWQERTDVVVLDPDGWNRKNFKWSWHKELITQSEFEKRLTISTCMFPARDWINEGIWKLEK